VDVRGRTRLQWCAGAPGIVAGAWEYLDEELLLAAHALRQAEHLRAATAVAVTRSGPATAAPPCSLELASMQDTRYVV
jgi:hypothetical protein